MEYSKEKLFAIKLIEKISAPHNAKENCQSITKKNTKLVKQLKIIT